MTDLTNVRKTYELGLGEPAKKETKEVKEKEAKTKS